MSKKKYALIAADFHPNIGGVVQFTLDIIKSLNAINRLEFVLSPHPYSDKQFAFPIKVIKPVRLFSNPRLVWIRKIDSLYTLFQQQYMLLFLITKLKFKKEVPILLINSLFNKYSWLAIKLARKFHLSYDIIIHGLDIIELSLQNREKLLEELINARTIIVNSNATQGLLYEYFDELKNHRIKILHPGFDKKILSKYLKSTMLVDFVPKAAQQKKLIVTVCRLVERKGVDLAISGLKSFLNSHTDWHFLIAGEGDQEGLLSKLISEKGLETSVQLIGKIDDDQKFTLLNSAKVFIMPNHLLNGQDFEGFGISFVEAQFFNNWIIAGKTGGAVEAVDSNDGYLIDFDFDPILQIESFILEISNNVNNSKEPRGQEFVCSHFDYNQMQLQLLNCLE